MSWKMSRILLEVTVLGALLTWLVVQALSGHSFLDAWELPFATLPDTETLWIGFYRLLEAIRFHATPPVNPFFLLWPTLFCVVMGIILTLFFKPTHPLLRAAVVGCMGLLAVRYEWWRLTATLNFEDPVTGVISVTLFLAELFLFFFYALSVMALEIKTTDRSAEADWFEQTLEQAMRAGDPVPEVDVFIPTLNEPVAILQRTVMACQAMRYPLKNVYLLDDGNRQEVNDLAGRLGCGYISRVDRTHFKAGNLNNALRQTQSPFIAVFDADFVPTERFLTRTIGFFTQPDVALVQTPQHFYNTDPYETNLGLENNLTNEQALFFRRAQPSRDAYNAVICSGTSFVVRRSALAQIQGFATESITEDFLTSIKLQANGWQVLYLNELLSAGDAPATIDIHIAQRHRWCRGTIQTLFTKDNPITNKRLNFFQRYYHFIGVMYWFTHLPRLFILCMPLVFFLFNIWPLIASLQEIIYYLMPVYLAYILFSAWLNGGYRSPFWSDVYEMVIAAPVTATLFHSLLFPFAKGFSVTPKQVSTEQRALKLHAAFPPLCLLTLFALGLLLTLRDWAWLREKESVEINLIWGGYAFLLLWLSVQASIDVPQDRDRVGRKASLAAVIKTSAAASQPWITQTEAVFETGVSLKLTALEKDRMQPGMLLKISLPELGFEELPCRWREPLSQTKGEPVFFAWESLSLEQARVLNRFLFSRPEGWPESSQTEAGFTWRFFQAAFRLHALTNRATPRAV